MFKFGVPTLIIRKFSISKDAAGGSDIEIIGRASGLTQWLLTLMKISTLTTLKTKGEELSLVSAGLGGEIHTVIPISAIESTECGFSKSIGWVVLGIIALLYGIGSQAMNMFLFSAIIAAICFAVYYMSGQMFISAMAGGREIHIKYKKGMIDGEKVDLESTLEAIATINAKVLNRQ